MSINYIKYAFDEYIEKPLDDKTLWYERSNFCYQLRKYKTLNITLHIIICEKTARFTSFLLLFWILFANHLSEAVVQQTNG
jgi:hypothetical protein